MKKIVAYIASRKGTDSNTYKFTKLILDKVKEKDKNIEFELITPVDINIEICETCEKCFNDGICLWDEKDDRQCCKAMKD